MRRQPRIVVIGGSLVGPSTALFLRAQGFTDVTVFEANPRPFSQSGGIMGVRNDTLAMLARVGITAESVRALTTPDVAAYDVSGDTTQHRGTSAFPGMTTSWDALHTELGGRVHVHQGHTVTSLVDDAGSTYVLCSCGEQHDADLIIWADGRKSTGRTLLDNRPLIYNGYVVWRGLVTPPIPTPVGFHRYYDIEGGRLFSVTEPVMQTGKSYFEFSHNLPAQVWQDLTGKRPEDAAYLLPRWVQRHRDQVLPIIQRAATGLPHRFAEIIDNAEISGIPVNDVAFPERLIHPHKSGALSVLVGDAAVPTRLQVGAGLNQGIQQAHDFVTAYAATNMHSALASWERHHLAELARWIELGRSRAHRNNLGWYMPVVKGKTSAPTRDQWTAPHWVTA